MCDTDTSLLPQLINQLGKSNIVLICEHASKYIPLKYNNLGLGPVEQDSHIAWDLGAKGLGDYLSVELDASLVACSVSRLMFDCNRPVDALDAMPTLSEQTNIPGNVNLSTEEQSYRIETIYQPFHELVNNTLQAKFGMPVIITLHSFTPVYKQHKRAVEIGVLHDTDSRLADALLNQVSTHTSLNVRINEPYGPINDVTHTLKKHALNQGLINVMLEIRNDLIATDQQQKQMAKMLAQWIHDALKSIN